MEARFRQATSSDPHFTRDEFEGGPTLTFPPLIPDLTARDRQPELMDAPDLHEASHRRALRALARINALSRSAHRVWSRLCDLGPRSGRELRLLDVACGGGDVAIAIKERAERAAMEVRVEACDRSPVALGFARENARRRGVEIEFFQHDVTAGALPGGFDLVCSSLFLHHLSDGESVRLLRGMAEAGRALLVQDLLRTRLGYLMAMAAVRTLSRSRIVRVDGPRSVRAAFSLEEVGSLAREAQLEGARLERCWPERFVLHWEGT